MLVHFHRHTVNTDLVLRKRRLMTLPVPADWYRYDFSAEDLRWSNVEDWIVAELVGRYAIFEYHDKPGDRMISVYLERDTDMVMLRLKGAEAAMAATVSS